MPQTIPRSPFKKHSNLINIKHITAAKHYYIIENFIYDHALFLCPRSLLKSSVMSLWRTTYPRSSRSFRRPSGCGAPIPSPSTCIGSPSGSPFRWLCASSWASGSQRKRCTVFSVLSKSLWRTFSAFLLTCHSVVIGR